MAKYTVIDLPKLAAIMAAADAAGFEVDKVIGAFVDVLTGTQKDFTDEIIGEFQDLVTRFRNAPVATSMKAAIFYGGTLFLFKQVGALFPRKSITIGKIRIKLCG